MNKLSSQNITIKNIISILKSINTNSTEIEKVNLTNDISNGRLVTRIEIVSRQKDKL